jgi:hypothetical protein
VCFYFFFLLLAVNQLIEGEEERHLNVNVDSRKSTLSVQQLHSSPRSETTKKVKDDDLFKSMLLSH